MYTLQMITDQLNSSLLNKVAILLNDSVCAVRIATGGEAEPDTLYLYPTDDPNTTKCMSGRGSVFYYETTLAETLNRLLEIQKYYDEWEESLTKAIRRGCTLSELLDLAYPLIPYPIIILDHDQWMIACSSAIREQDVRNNEDISDLLKYHSTSSEKIAAFNQAFYDYYQRKDVYQIPGEVFSTNTAFAMNLFHEDFFTGVMLIEGFGVEIPQGKLDLFYLFGKLIQEMLNDPSSGLSIGAGEPSFIRFLNLPSPELKEELLHDLIISTWKEGDEKQLIYITPSSGKGLAPNLNHAVLMFNRLFGLKAAEYQGGILLFLNMRILKERSGYEPTLERIRQLSYCAGCSNSFYDIDRIPVMAGRAYAALQAGDRHSGAINFFEDNYLKFFFSLVEKDDRELLRHPLLDQLREYDRRYGSRLSDTLFHFLKNERGITRTAQEMHLHRSTLIHRIERIESLAPGLLEDPDTRMHLLLSYYLEQQNVNDGE